MSAPSLSLALIARDEEKNINRLLDSVEGCFDEIVLVDTGSVDKTKEIAESRGCKVYDFEWIQDFSKARNFAFSKTTSEYVMWLDLDDVLHNREGFLEWKKSAMQFADLFLNTYNYAIKPDGTPAISFMRERVFKKSINPIWQYPLHEGIVMKPGWKIDYACSWAVNHLRDADDLKKDKSRNITILEKLKKDGKLDIRLQFYYAKELFEAGRHEEAVLEFDKAIEAHDLQIHDRLLSYQYANYAAQAIADTIKDEFKEKKAQWYDRAIKYALEGLKYDSSRAELFTSAGDCYIKMGNINKALPLYAAAKNCVSAAQGPYAQPIFQFSDCYGQMPSLQMAKIFLNTGRIEDAEKEAKEIVEKYNHPEAEQILSEIKRIRPLIRIDNNQEQTEDIVFTCPPNQAYPFDEEIYKTKPLGGSETALVQMAKLLKEKTGRRVIVFNVRENDLVSESGVEYISNRKMNEYLSKFKPAVNIMWRHNIELTRAPSYLWAHDLLTPAVEYKSNFDKMMCLSEFHKSFTIGKTGLDAKKIWVTRNGIDPEKFKAMARKPKNPNKLVWMSSPDRGLDRAMLVCDRVREAMPDIELHVYYGIENLYKYGPQMSALADKLKGMMNDRPYVKYHGFTEQSKMYHEVSDAVVWIHPCDFIETFCITALEMLALGIFPVTRKLGALINTLADAEANGRAVLLDHDCVTEKEFALYADATIKALKEKSWENVTLDLEKHSWSSVADEWIKEMNLFATAEIEGVAV